MRRAKIASWGRNRAGQNQPGTEKAQEGKHLRHCAHNSESYSRKQALLGVVIKQSAALNEFHVSSVIYCVYYYAKQEGGIQC